MVATPPYTRLMATSRVDEEIARLYQLPLADFTAARNALAKQAGARASEVKALQKPPVAAWAINQLFWQRRDVYDRLIGAAGDLRAAHGAVLAGKSGDVRAAGESHEEAIEAALKATLALLRDAGQPATDATRQAIATTLRALPGTDPPGHLSATLQPGGFEMLSRAAGPRQAGLEHAREACRSPGRQPRSRRRRMPRPQSARGKRLRRRNAPSGSPNTRFGARSSRRLALPVRRRKRTRPSARRERRCTRPKKH